MKKMTEQNLINAFGGESQANMRYLHFANQAEKEGFLNVARLFRAIAHAEFIHASDHYRELSHLDGGFVAPAGSFRSETNLEGRHLDRAIRAKTCIWLSWAKNSKLQKFIRLILKSPGTSERRTPKEVLNGLTVQKKSIKSFLKERKRL